MGMQASFVKSLIERIPVEREPLFAYPIEWDVIEKEKIIENKVKPWLVSKVAAYLEKFVLAKLKSKCTAEELFEDVQLALGSETELFVKLLWRLLIFHILSTKTS